MSTLPVKIHINKKESINVFCYDSDIKKALQNKGSLEYFIRGQGRKKSKKKFEVIKELPEKWAGSDMSWFKIAEITDKYGLNIGGGYADCKVAGIIARQTAAGYCEMYRRCKHLITPEYEKFFDNLRCDYMMSCFGIYELDIINLDEHLAKNDPNYSAEGATYMGDAISMNAYVKLKYGPKAVEIIDACIAGPVEFVGRSEKITRFVNAHYLYDNVLELTLEEFDEWAEEMDIERVVNKAIKEIESHTLVLSL